MTMRVETSPWAPYAALLEHGFDGAGEALCIPVNEWEHLKPALCAEGAITDGCLRLSGLSPDAVVHDKGS